MAAAIKKCKCDHKDQDQMYGRGQRVYTQTTNGWRCTVCGTEINTGAQSRKKK